MLDYDEDIEGWSSLQTPPFPRWMSEWHDFIRFGSSVGSIGRAGGWGREWTSPERNPHVVRTLWSSSLPRQCDNDDGDDDDTMMMVMLKEKKKISPLETCADCRIFPTANVFHCKDDNFHLQDGDYSDDVDEQDNHHNYESDHQVDEDD